MPSLEKGFQGVLSDLSNDKYHASEAIGSTDIKAARQSLAHFKAQISGQKQYSKPTREAFDLGTAAHEMVLEKSADKFLKGPEVSSKAVKEWKAFVEANPDKIILTPSEYNRVIAMFTAFHAHPVAPKLLNQCKVEQSYFAIDHNTGLWVKARPDAVCDHAAKSRRGQASKPFAISIRSRRRAWRDIAGTDVLHFLRRNEGPESCRRPKHHGRKDYGHRPSNVQRISIAGRDRRRAADDGRDRRSDLGEASCPAAARIGRRS